MLRYIPIHCALLALFAVVSCAPSNEPVAILAASSVGSCERPISAFIDAAEAQGVKGRQLAKKERDSFVDAYNALPPVSNDNPQQVWVFPAGAVVFVLFVDGGCVGDIHRVPEPVFVDMIAGGRPA